MLLPCLLEEVFRLGVSGLQRRRERGQGFTRIVWQYLAAMPAGRVPTHNQPHPVVIDDRRLAADVARQVLSIDLRPSAGSVCVSSKARPSFTVH
jgi:hypothetical protein